MGAGTLALMGVGAGSLAGILGSAANAQLVALGGFLLGVAIVAGVSYWQVRRHRAHMPPSAFRRLFMQQLTRVGAWSVAAYLVYFLVIQQTILYKLGVSLPRPH